MAEMTPERLAEIEARAAVATPGPWVLTFQMEDPYDKDGPVKLRLEKIEDVQFAAMARTDIPDLIAALRQAWEERDNARWDDR